MKTPAPAESQSPDQSGIEMLSTAEAVAIEAPQLVPIYQMAFAGEPSREVSACRAPDQFENACKRRRSELGIGETCPKCGEVLQEPAFPEKALIVDWTSHFNARDSRFYIERFADGSHVVAAMAWKASARALAKRCYAESGEEEMHKWLPDRLPGDFVWLEDIFADLSLRSSGNLWNHRKMILRFLSELKGTVLAFRSINEGLIEKTIRLFGPQAERLVAGEDVPDDRHLVVVRLSS